MVVETFLICRSLVVHLFRFLAILPESNEKLRQSNRKLHSQWAPAPVLLPASFSREFSTWAEPLCPPVLSIGSRHLGASRTRRSARSLGQWDVTQKYHAARSWRENSAIVRAVGRSESTSNRGAPPLKVYLVLFRQILVINCPQWRRMFWTTRKWKRPSGTTWTFSTTT